MSDALHGVLAEFADGDALLRATRAARAEGYRAIDAYSPLPLDGLAEAIGFPRTRVPLITLIGGIAGGAGAYFLQWYTAVIDYPINVGGRPLHSWPAFIVPTFELTVLGAALAAVFGMLALNRLPAYQHPVFNVAEFHLASRNRFFLCLRADDRRFNPASARAFLEAQRAMKIWEVPA
jgi:hypothetical protein